MKLKFPIFILGLFFLKINTLSAQNIELLISFNDTILSSSKIINYNKKNSLIGLKQEINNALHQLHEKAYLTASTDSIIIDSNYYNVYLHLGKAYKWSYLKNKNIDEEILSKIGFRDKVYNNKPFNQRQLKAFYNKVISFYENNGYPFASICLDSVAINNHKLCALVKINKAQLCKIDSVIIKGDATISDQYIKNYINIKDGSIYNEQLVRKISTRIKELPFVSEQQKFKVVFTDKFSKIFLYLKKKQASKFNGILGILSDNKTGKIRLTGDLKLNLINSFSKGEEINFNWRSIQEKTQDLNFKLVYPFIFNSPLGIDYNFKLYKKDTTYIDVYNTIGIRYILKGNNYFKLFFNNQSSSLLTQSRFTTLTVLPSFADISSQLYGLEMYNSRLDYILNPRKGYYLKINGSLGNKTIRENPKIDKQLYANLDLKSTIYNFNLNTAYYLPIKKRSVLKFESKNGYTSNKNLFNNELYRIGGLLTLRGFDEESIFASLYSIETFEYRFILEQNSYLFAFIDGAYYESKEKDKFLADRPVGFGVGMSFETNAGIFSISYAIGKQFNNPILFRAAKVHFGFVNFF